MMRSLPDVLEVEDEFGRQFRWFTGSGNEEKNERELCSFTMKGHVMKCA